MTGDKSPPLAMASAPADWPATVSRGKLIPELGVALTGCARITATGSAHIIEPLQFIGLSDASGRLKADLPRFHHAHGDSRG